MRPEELKEFLKRNEEYSNLSKKKMEILKKSAAMYDFKTGEKLFSPKISDFPSQIHQSSSKNMLHKGSDSKISPPDQKQPKSGIFSKKYQNY